MKWLSLYLVGYLLFMAGVFVALWKWGALDEMGPTWTLVAVLVALGLGVMISVSNSGQKENIDIDTH